MAYYSATMTDSSSDFEGPCTEHEFLNSSDRVPLLRHKRKLSHQLLSARMLEVEEGHFRRLLCDNKHATVVYCLVFWSFGMCVGFLGPTLWDLGLQTETTLPAMPWVFFSQSLFILIGSMLGGLAIEM